MNKYLKYSILGFALLGTAYLSFYTLSKFNQARIDSKETKLEETANIFKNVK